MTPEDEKIIGNVLREMVGEQFIFIFPVNDVPLVIVGGTDTVSTERILRSIADKLHPNSKVTKLNE